MATTERIQRTVFSVCRQGPSPPLPPPSLPSATLRHPRRSAPAVGVLLEAHGGGLSCNRGRRYEISVVEKLPLRRAMREASNVRAFFGGSDSFAPLGVAGQQYLATSTETDGGLCRACVCVRTYLRPYVLSPDLLRRRRPSGDRNEEESDGCPQKAAPLPTSSAKKSANGTTTPRVVAAFFSRRFPAAPSPTSVSSSPPTRAVLNRRIFLRQVGGQRFAVEPGSSTWIGSDFGFAHLRGTAMRLAPVPSPWPNKLLIFRLASLHEESMQNKRGKRSKHGAV